MDVQAEVDREREAVQRITTVARRSACPVFLDLLWDCVSIDLSVLTKNPGVMFESPRRIVVFQEISGEVRYYAGGWRSDESRIYLEQDRIEAEGCELGVFEAVRDAMAFAEQYLVEERSFQTIHVPRQVRYGRVAQSSEGRGS